MSEQEQEQQSAYEECMNQVIDVEDEVFENNRGIPISPDKKRSSILVFVEDVDTATTELKRKKKDAINHVSATNNTQLLQHILQTLTNFQDEQRVFNRKQEFFRIVSENKESRSMGWEVMDVPFIRPSVIPENIELPLVRSVEEVDRQTFSQVKLYLQASDIAFNNSWPRKRLKELLRNKLGFTSRRDLTINMS